jgi:cytochrome c oxidase subunit 3
MGVSIAPAARRPDPLTVGVALWLASEVMFFAGLFAAYFALRSANTPWPPAGVHLDTVRAAVFTLALIASSGTLHVADVAAAQGDEQRARSWTVATLGLGAVFLANQVYEWVTANFHVSENSYGTIFFVMTGFHGLHVLVGLVLLGIVAVRPPHLPTTVPGLRRGTTWYWHFVDVVWVGMYSTIFLIR